MSGLRAGNGPWVIERFSGPKPRAGFYVWRIYNGKTQWLRHRNNRPLRYETLEEAQDTVRGFYQIHGEEVE